jgi:hypothetical protein
MLARIDRNFKNQTPAREEFFMIAKKLVKKSQQTCSFFVIA